MRMKRIIFMLLILLLGGMMSKAVYSQYRKATPTPTPVSRKKPAPKDDKDTIKATPQPRTKIVRTGPKGVSTRPQRKGFSLKSKTIRLDLKTALDTSRPVLMITTEDSPNEGEKFKTDIILSNPISLTVDTIGLVLSYDPAFVLPVGGNDEELLKRGIKDREKTVKIKSGILQYLGKFPVPLVDSEIRLLTIEWQALKDTSKTTIRFESDGELATSVSYRGRDILGKPNDSNDGMIPLSLPIRKVLSEEEDDYFDQVFLDESPVSLMLPESGVSLALRSERDVITEGEDFFVSIFFENRSQTPVDSFALLIGFDPAVLKVLDYDEEGWIIRGTNIYDGAHHEQFPFDYHVANEADNIRGEILYKMGITRSDVLFISGEMARIRFLAVQPVEKTWIRFITSSQSSQQGTKVTYMGVDVLGKKSVAGDGAGSISLKVAGRK